MPEFSDQRLDAGRAIWMGTCRNCHLLGVAGAPAVTDFAEWDLRLPKGKEALYESALHGVRGDDGLYRMPPQGGNQRLSQEQVRLAVDYKVAAIEQLRTNKGGASAE
jgi:cytochrome c5